MPVSGHFIASLRVWGTGNMTYDHKLLKRPSFTTTIRNPSTKLLVLWTLRVSSRTSITAANRATGYTVAAGAVCTNYNPTSLIVHWLLLQSSEVRTSTNRHENWCPATPESLSSRPRQQHVYLKEPQRLELFSQDAASPLAPESTEHPKCKSLTAWPVIAAKILLIVPFSGFDLVYHIHWWL